MPPSVPEEEAFGTTAKLDSECLSAYGLRPESEPKQTVFPCHDAVGGL